MKYINITDTNVIFVDGATKVAYPLNSLTYVQNGANVTFYPSDDFLCQSSVFTVNLPFQMGEYEVTEENADELLSALFVNTSGSGPTPTPTPTGNKVTSDEINVIKVESGADYNPETADEKTLYILL